MKYMHFALLALLALDLPTYGQIRLHPGDSLTYLLVLSIDYSIGTKKGPD